MRKDAPLAIDVPSPSKDSPGWVKVGVIAAVGFVIGIAWPRVMGVKLGPNAPGESAAAASASAKAARAPDAPAAASVPVAKASAKAETTTASATATSASASSGPPQISVLRGTILGCKTDEGESKKGKECGSVGGIDQLVGPRLKKLSTCAAAEGQTGKLSFMVTADFAGSKLTWDIGKSTTVGNQDGISGCLKTIFQGVGLAGVAHEHPKYTVAYNATFAPSSSSPDAKDDSKKEKDAKDAKAKEEPPKKDEPKKDEAKDDAPTDKPASGEAAVAWEVALVRDTPKTGQVVARLPRGTKVKIGSSKDGWYSVKYGDGFASEGWVYRGAIGR